MIWTVGWVRWVLMYLCMREEKGVRRDGVEGRDVRFLS